MAMLKAISPFLNLLEALAFSAYVGWYIWQLQSAVWSSWIVFPVWLIASFLLHKDTPKTLGWRVDNLRPATKRAAAVFAPFVVGLVIAGFLLGGAHRRPGHLLVPRHFFAYLAFCLMQQVGLNSLVTNRLLAATDKPFRAALASATLFAALHWPNPVLVPLTWIGGLAMSLLFTRDRNVFPLTFGQGILGALVWWTFPVAWHHAMRVGPGFYHFHQGP